MLKPLVRFVAAVGISLAVGTVTGCSDNDGFLAVPGEEIPPPPPPPAPTSTATVPAPMPTSTIVSTATPTLTSVPTGTPTATPSPVATATETIPAAGPVITFFGIARPDDVLIDATGVDDAGVPFYTRTIGSGFRIVVEAAPGSNGAPPGNSAFSPDGTTPPALQIASSRPLGDGSPAVCDRTRPDLGGVPALDPPIFSSDPAVVAVMNDLSCRFLDGGGAPRGRDATTESCVLVPAESGIYAFAAPTTRMQFCTLVDRSFAFPQGDTLLTVRLLDRNGIPGPAAQIILRVQE